MSVQPPPAGPSPVRWLVGVLADPGKRVDLLFLFTYVSGLSGLALAFLGAGGTGRLTVLGVALMFAAFVAMFFASVTLVEVRGGERDEGPP